MIGIDTNVVVRYLIEDDPGHTGQVHRLLARAGAQGERVWVSTVVLCEALWVLDSIYRVPKPRIGEAVAQLLDADIFEVETADLVRVALEMYGAGKAAFADYLIGQLHLARVAG